MDKKKLTSKERGAQIYSGVAIDKADDNKVSQQNIHDRTKQLNNNPRNHD